MRVVLLAGISFFFLIHSGNIQAASVSGKILFQGSAPEPKKAAMDADPSCQLAHPDGITLDEVVVNANGTLKNVFIYVKEGLSGQTFEPPKEAVVIDQYGCAYNPHVFGIQVNQTLEILNSDDTLHNVHALAKTNKEFNLGMPIKGMKLTKKFTSPEIMVKFKCEVHPWMSAYVGIVNHPFYSVSNEEGNFNIQNLPVGEYVLEAWHEKYGLLTQQVTLRSAEESQEITFEYQS